MKRLTLAGQVALIVALAIFVVQFFNLALAIDHRRDLALAQSVAPAAQRLIFAAERPEILERRQERRERRARRHGGRGGEPRDRFLRPRAVPDDPVPGNARRLVAGERVLQARFDEAGIPTLSTKVGVLEPQFQRGHRQILIFGVQLEDGSWLTTRAPGPPSMRPLIGILLLQSILIGLAILIPTLLLLRRVGGSLTSLRRAAATFDGAVPTDPVAPSGPKDVRSLIEAVNAMQARIATMLAEKDVMLGAIGHDLRTPLTALRIEAESIDHEEQRDALIAQVEALHAQFEQILDFARTGKAATAREPRDLAPLVEEWVAAAREQDKDVTLGTIEPVSAKVDGAALSRAMSNLIDNGIRYAGPVAVSLEKVDGTARLSVADTGPGLTDAQKELARTPFGRLDPSRNRASGGHGLGLAIVEAIARAHGGELLLDDNEPGLRAIIALPALD